MHAPLTWPGSARCFFPPLFPPPPPGPTAPPHTGRAWAARRRGGARGARAGPAPRGRKGGGAGAARGVCSRPRARRRRRELGEEEEGRELKEQDSPFPDPPFFTSPPHTVKGPDGLASPLAGIICPPERKYVPHPPLSGSPSSVPRGPAARLRVRAKYRAEARSLGPASRSRCPRRSLLLCPQCAPPPPALPVCLAPRGRRCHLLAGVVLLWPSCAERGRSCSHRPSRGPRPPRGYRDVGCCCPRLHPLLIMFTVPPATLPDFSNSSEASNQLSTPGLKDILTFCKAQQSSVLNFLSSVSKFYEITPILPFPPFSELIPISCQGKRPRKVDDLDYFTPTI